MSYISVHVDPGYEVFYLTSSIYMEENMLFKSFSLPSDYRPAGDCYMRLINTQPLFRYYTN